METGRYPQMKKTEKLSTYKLVGSYFNIIESGELKYQGRIVDKVNDEYYLCQFYKLGSVTETHARINPLSRMITNKWRFHRNKERFDIDANNYII